MDVFSAVLVYILIWWIVIFCVLPMNIQSIGKTDKGFMPGAPINPDLQKKLLITTIVSTVIWVAIYLVIKSNLISFHDMAMQMDH